MPGLSLLRIYCCKSAAEAKDAMPSLSDGGLLISLARSGDSPESVAVVQKFQRLFPSVEHLAIVCNAEGRLAHTPGVEAICLDPRTNDRSLAMTSSFSNLVLGGLALIQGAALAQHLPDICDWVSNHLLELNASAASIARSREDRVVVLASGMHALTLEGPPGQRVLCSSIFRNPITRLGNQKLFNALRTRRDRTRARKNGSNFFSVPDLNDTSFFTR